MPGTYIEERTTPMNKVPRRRLSADSESDIPGAGTKRRYQPFLLIMTIIYAVPSKNLGARSNGGGVLLTRSIRSILEGDRYRRNASHVHSGCGIISEFLSCDCSGIQHLPSYRTCDFFCLQYSEAPCTCHVKVGNI